MYKLIFYVPESHKEGVKEAVFAAGAGRISPGSRYRRCSWEVLGTGQFEPGPDSRPFLGQPGELERTAEYRVETAVPEAALPAVLAALREAHPYEEPALEYFPVRIS